MPVVSLVAHRHQKRTRIVEEPEYVGPCDALPHAVNMIQGDTKQFTRVLAQVKV